MFKKLLLALTLVSLPLLAQDEVYMENQAGGYLALTHQECKVDKLKDTFPYHAYGVDGEGNVLGQACYQIPKLPNQEEMAEVPEGMSVIPVVNVIDLQDGEVHTLQANWFTGTKPGSF
jgi:hypothetical protein